MHPVHPVRLGPARFRVICEPPMALPDTNDRTADVYALTLAMDERYTRAVDSRAAGMLVVATSALVEVRPRLRNRKRHSWCRLTWI